ncbi:MAG TPA: hypothetical protein VFV38_14870 [Ktedonobacteraceae bacterium]|nr:hypothetical protein [Ktedonobacteraceae bacterium]
MTNVRHFRLTVATLALSALLVALMTPQFVQAKTTQAQIAAVNCQARAFAPTLTGFGIAQRIKGIGNVVCSGPAQEIDATIRLISDSSGEINSNSDSAGLTNFITVGTTGCALPGSGTADTYRLVVSGSWTDLAGPHNVATVTSLPATLACG